MDLEVISRKLLIFRRGLTVVIITVRICGGRPTGRPRSIIRSWVALAAGSASPGACRCRPGRLRDLVYVYLHTFVERIGRIDHDPIGGFQALQDFQRGAIVTADHQRLQVRFVIVIDDHGAQTFGAEQQRVHRNFQPRAVHFYFQMHLRVSPR